MFFENFMVDIYELSDMCIVTLELIRGYVVYSRAPRGRVD